MCAEIAGSEPAPAPSRRSEVLLDPVPGGPVSADDVQIKDLGNCRYPSPAAAHLGEGAMLFVGEADKVLVEYGAGGVNDVKTFTALGGVKIKTKDQTATGEKAVFVPATQILTMTGNVKVDGAMGSLSGPQLVIDLKTNTSVFSGGSKGRVTGVFTPQ